MINIKHVFVLKKNITSVNQRIKKLIIFFKNKRFPGIEFLDNIFNNKNDNIDIFLGPTLCHLDNFDVYLKKFEYFNFVLYLRFHYKTLKKIY